jgi:hypothetical protein
MPTEQLTSVQADWLQAVAWEWENVGLATGPADRPRAERGIKAAYTAAGLPPPDLVLWARSPLEGALGTAHLAVLSGTAQGRRLGQALRGAYGDLAGWLGGEARGRLWEPYTPSPSSALEAHLTRACLDSRRVREVVGSNVLRRAEAEARASLGPRLRQQLRSQLRDRLRERVVRTVWGLIATDLQARTWPRLKARLEEQRPGSWRWQRRWAVVRDLYRLIPVQDALNGPLGDRASLDWLALYDFLARGCGLAESAAASGLMEVARSCGWWWPHRSAVVLCERPLRLLRDHAGRLHGEGGPAVVYPDGWSVWAWHGVSVPRRVIEQPQALAPAEVLAEPDPEVRQVMIEMAGRVTGAGSSTTV